ncbi:GNAT family N-acetyltransferase [Veronia nyctiphanis]|uniref:GNAT family N-acetyltransferase n=1 Tax=Veronia nyctiphanis TaxID=1278244 RepID=A0A4Q0YM22_9GAMM|nr:GNAT family protein [Veronia nyctiphanis]RXJ71877.1 GNAT family N-acetyltransferase [Veronia nyctiphanis]
MLKDEDLLLRCALPKERNLLWRQIFLDNEWKALDAPYTPLEYQSRLYFRMNLFKRLRDGETALVIEYQGQLVGYLSCYWEDQSTRWLEVGITLFESQNWGKQLGRRALKLWISHLFKKYELARIGLTTWSGNPRMMRCAEAMGLTLEGRLRKVRFYQGKYFDSLRYGVLREEWFSQVSKRVLAEVS